MCINSRIYCSFKCYESLLWRRYFYGIRCNKYSIAEQELCVVNTISTTLLSTSTTLILSLSMDRSMNPIQCISWNSQRCDNIIVYYHVPQVVWTVWKLAVGHVGAESLNAFLWAHKKSGTHTWKSTWKLTSRRSEHDYCWLCTVISHHIRVCHSSLTEYDIMWVLPRHAIILPIASVWCSSIGNIFKVQTNTITVTIQVDKDFLFSSVINCWKYSNFIHLNN